MCKFLIFGLTFVTEIRFGGQLLSEQERGCQSVAYIVQLHTLMCAIVRV